MGQIISWLAKSLPWLHSYPGSWTGGVIFLLPYPCHMHPTPMGTCQSQLSPIGSSPDIIKPRPPAARYLAIGSIQAFSMWGGELATYLAI